MNETITIQNVELKNYKDGFGKNGLGKAGTIYFKDKKVLSFYEDTCSNYFKDIEIHDTSLEQDILNYLNDEHLNGMDVYILEVIRLHKIKETIQIVAKDAIIDYLNDHKGLTHTKVAAYVYDSKDYLEVEVDTLENIEVINGKPIYKEHPKGIKTDNLYFVRFLNNKYIVVLEIKK